MVWVDQVKVGRLPKGILLNIENSPSKCLLQEANVSLNLVSYDKNTLKSAYLWSSSDLH